jgi:hypothetical protein
LEITLAKQERLPTKEITTKAMEKIILNTVSSNFLNR